MITVYQIQGQHVPPLADARLYELLSGGGVGVVVGCEITSLGGLQLRISSGWILIQGRWIAIAEETVTVTPSGSGQVDGQALLHIDVSNTESPGAWVFNAQTPLPAPVQEDINGSGTIYEMQMCNYKVDQLQVTDLQTTYPVLGTAASYLYKATFDMGSWTPGSGNVTQTATLVPVDGGPPVTSGSTLLACIGTDSTLPAETKDAMAGPASDIAGAEKTLGAGTISVTLDSAPDVDVELYFYIKQGVSPAVPPLDPVGAGGIYFLGSATGTQSISFDFSSGKYIGYIFEVAAPGTGNTWTWEAFRTAQSILQGDTPLIVYMGGQANSGGYVSISSDKQSATLTDFDNYSGSDIVSKCTLSVYGVKI